MDSLFSSSDLSAIWLTVKLASLVTFIIGTPLAWRLVAHTNSAFKGAVSTVLALPIVLSPTVIDFYLLLAKEPSAPLG